MEQFDLFGMDGFDFGFGALEEAPKTEKKAEKASAKKDSAATKSAGKGKKKAKDFDVTLPVTVKSRGFKTEISGLGTKKVSEILTELMVDYPELAFDEISAVYDATVGVLYITDACIFTSEDTLVDMSKNIVICDGDVKCEVSLDMFPGKDADEVSVEHLLDKWVEVNPLYKGCRLIYAESEQGAVAHPAFNAILPSNELVSVPSQILMDGEWRTLDTEITIGDLQTQLCGNINENVSVSIYANLDKSAYFLTYKQKKGASVSKGKSSELSKSTKKVEERYKLPLKVYIATWNGTYNLTPADFDGKEKVTLDDVKAYFLPKYKIFGDTSRKMDVIYLEDEQTLSIMFVSGKKGADAEKRVAYSAEHSGRYELLRSLRDLNEAVRRPFFHGTLVSSIDAPKGSVRVESFPVGTYLLTQESETGDIISLDYELKLPKIPRHILNTIIANFRRDLSKEAWVKLCYKQASGEYLIIKGKEQTSKASVSYTLSSEEFFSNRDVLQVMDIHSHNTMPAFFSATDDADECYPGLFGVIGRLDKDVPDVRLRAGYEGIFKDLALSDLFESEPEHISIVEKEVLSYGNI